LCMKYTGLYGSTQKSAIFGRNRVQIGLSPSTCDVQSSLRGMLHTIQVVTTLDPTANKI
jgi:hypothetical protein